MVLSKKGGVLIFVGVLLLAILNAFFCTGFSALGKDEAELHFYRQVSGNGFAIRISPFRKIEIWPIGSNVRSGIVDGQTIFKIGK